MTQPYVWLAPLLEVCQALLPVMRLLPIGFVVSQVGKISWIGLDFSVLGRDVEPMRSWPMGLVVELAGAGLPCRCPPWIHEAV